MPYMYYSPDSMWTYVLIVLPAVLIALLNVCTFAIPFNKVDLVVHLIAYGCAEFVIVAEMILVISQLFLEGNPNQKVIGLPILCFGYIALGIQMLATAIFYLVNAFVAVPVWLVVLIECIIIGFEAIQMAGAFFFKARNEC